MEAVSSSVQFDASLRMAAGYHDSGNLRELGRPATSIQQILLLDLPPRSFNGEYLGPVRWEEGGNRLPLPPASGSYR